MRKLILVVVMLFLASSSPCIAKEIVKDYWVYVRLEDRSGVTAKDDVGRSKRGDVVAVLPVNAQHLPSKTEKNEWLIYKTSLTVDERNKLLEGWQEEKDGIITAKAYRRNTLDIGALGVVEKRGLVAEKIIDKTITSVKTVADLSRYERKRYLHLVIRPFIKWYSDAVRYLVKPVWAFATTTCADNDTEDREQICTVNKTGEDYNTIILWEDAKDTDLVTDKQIRTCHVYDDQGDLQSNVIEVTGATTSSTYFMKITAPEGERHDGTVSSGAKLQYDPAVANNILAIGITYSVIEWLILEPKQGGNGVNTGTGSHIIVRNNIVFNSNATGSSIGLKLGFNNGEYKVYNNIIYDMDTGIHGLGDYQTHYVYNNTIQNCDTGIYAQYGTWVIKNTAVQDASTAGYTGSAFGSASTNNLSSDTTTPEYNTYYDSKTLVFANKAGNDFHLASNDSDAIDLGADLGTGDEVEIDIDGRDRDAESDTWDIGADEYVSAAADTSPILKLQGNLRIQGNVRFF